MSTRPSATQLSARNAVAKYLGVTRGHAELLVQRLSPEQHAALVAAVNEDKPDQAAASMRKILDDAAKASAVEHRTLLGAKRAEKQKAATAGGAAKPDGETESGGEGETGPDPESPAPATNPALESAPAATEPAGVPTSEPPARARRGKGAK